MCPKDPVYGPINTPFVPLTPFDSPNTAPSPYVMPNTTIPWPQPVPSAPYIVPVPDWSVQSTPPPVCPGTGWLPAQVQGNPHWSVGSYKCGICGQMVLVDPLGKLTLHPYIKVG